MKLLDSISVPLYVGVQITCSRIVIICSVLIVFLFLMNIDALKNTIFEMPWSCLLKYIWCLIPLVCLFTLEIHIIFIHRRIMYFLNYFSFFYEYRHTDITHYDMPWSYFLKGTILLWMHSETVMYMSCVPHVMYGLVCVVHFVIALLGICMTKFVKLIVIVCLC